MKAAIMGFGTVGSGVYEVLDRNRETVRKKAGEPIEIKYILNRRDLPGSPVEELVVHEIGTILEDPETGLVVETMGGTSPAYEYVKCCLQAGKHVVTSNKNLVAAHGTELLAIAREKRVSFLFEASVGGGIPIIRPISQCLAANDVIEIAGILNGTTNFILTKMIRENMKFEDALALAQKLGYAERNPAADIEGADACRKICILASLAFGKHVYPEQVHTQGITKITLEDVAYAAAWGGVIKLIGQVKKLDNGKVEIVVAPMFISHESQLSSVDDVFNGILVRGDATGDVVFYGKGAGKLPTASAVVADIIDCVKHFKARKYLYWDDAQESYVSPYEDSVISVYIRAAAENDHKGLRIAEKAFGKVKRLVRSDAPEGEFAFVTEPKSVMEINACCEAMKAQGVEVLSMIRLSDL